MVYIYVPKVGRVHIAR